MVDGATGGGIGDGAPTTAATATPTVAPNAADAPARDAMSGLAIEFWRAVRPAIPAWLLQDLTFGQLRLLFYLKRNGGTATMSGIAEWLGVALPTATGVVERVERHGFVERRHRLDDRRIVECALTPAGDDLLSEILGARDETMRRMLALLTPDERAELDGLFTRIRARLETAAAPDSGLPNPAESKEPR